MYAGATTRQRERAAGRRGRPCGSSARPERPLPAALLSSRRMLRRASLVLGLFACNSDDPLAQETGGETLVTSTGAASTSTGPEPTSTGTTLVPTTGEGTSSGFIAGSSTGEPPPEVTCRDVLECIGPCAFMLDSECFLGCTEGLTPEEVSKLGALALCVGQGCFEAGTCALDTLQDPACIACVGLGVLVPSPPGCEEQAEACQ